MNHNSLSSHLWSMASFRAISIYSPICLLGTKTVHASLCWNMSMKLFVVQKILLAAWCWCQSSSLSSIEHIHRPQLVCCTLSLSNIEQFLSVMCNLLLDFIPHAVYPRSHVCLNAELQLSISQWREMYIGQRVG